jgi:predicted TIM-barrel fold metal-dependent hydrolase
MPVVHDAHVHLTNYVQQGTDIREFLKIMGNKVGRSTIIWAHCGLGRIVRPIKDQTGIVDRMLSDPAFHHVYVDISWDEVAKHIVATPEAIQHSADIINRHPDRVLFGTDEVALKDQAGYLKVYDMYAPLFAKLTPEASEKLRKVNYERLFDAARVKVRAWEKANLK